MIHDKIKIKQDTMQTKERSLLMNTIRIQREQTPPLIAPELHSQFIEYLGGCIKGGIWVGKDSDIPNIHGIRKDVIDALAQIAPPVVRWPGGCYADTYHWRDGVGPKRKETWNTNFTTWESETNEFGTHEFMEFCKAIGARPWININMLSGTTGEMAEWAEYCNRQEPTDLSRERAENGSPESFGVEYWGIGNEVWGGGGKYTAKGYANEYRRYAGAMPRFAHMAMDENGPHMVGTPTKLIASGPDGNKPLERVRWTKDFFKALGGYRLPDIWGYDLHFYNWNMKQMESESSFTEDDWYRVIFGAMELEDVIKEQDALMKDGLHQIPPEENGAFAAREWNPQVKLVVGEWGNWHGSAFRNQPALWQQCTMRDAITTAITMDIFHRNCDIVSMACAAQTVNVLNSLILTDGSSTILTPNYYVTKMYKPHRGGKRLVLEEGTSINTVYIKDGIKVPEIYTFASEKDGIITVNLVNSSFCNPSEVEIILPSDICTYLSGQILTSDDPHDVNDAEHPAKVVPVEASSSAVPVVSKKNPDEITFRFTVPSASVCVYQFSEK